MDLRGRRLLVIGGAGFIGSHVVDRLTGEDVGQIVVYDDFTRGRADNLQGALRDPRVKVFEVGGNILHRDILGAAMKDADCVFHLAALWLLHCHDYPRSAFEVNIGGTFNVLEACVAAGVKRLVYSSSASVYGDAVVTPMTEDHPFNNRTFYGATKIAGEQMCRAFHHRYGLSYVGLRYMNVYGARQDERGAYTSVIMKVLERIADGLPPIVFGDGSQTYDFIYVDDVARANVLAAKSDATDRFYNVGRGVGTSLSDLVKEILRVTESDLEIEYRPAGQTFVTQRIGSTERAARDLGFEAEIDLTQGLRRLLEWRRKHTCSEK
ncbi:MAG TPA: NAD-dependent epimerase/dehydratase family protein [Methylomirabilota bacterium]|nr:NAD-dependent epimerase/dehydratase family protein [Methylomirabilota bacterium]